MKHKLRKNKIFQLLFVLSLTIFALGAVLLTLDAQDGAPPPPINFNIPELPAGKSITVVFDVTVNNPPSPGTTQVCNQGVITGTGGINVVTDDPDTPAADDPTCTAVSVLTDLSITKDDGGITAVPGDTITYTLTYSNSSSQLASGVVITETVPANSQFNPTASSAGWTCLPNNNAGSNCTNAIGTVPAMSGAITVDFAVDVNLPLAAGVTQIDNVATIGSNEPDENPANNSANDTTPLNASPDLQISKDDLGAVVEPGDTILYSLAITNTGSQNATGVIMTDTVPANTTFNAGVSSAGWSCNNGDPGGTPCTFDLSAVIGGEFAGNGELVVLVTFAVDVDDPVPGGTFFIDNTVEVYDDGANGPDPNPQDNMATAQTPLNIPGTIIIEKLVLPDVNATENFTFTIDLNPLITFNLQSGEAFTATNIPVDTYTVVEADPDPSGYFLADISCDDDNSNGNVNSRTATIILEPAETVRCTFTNRPVDFSVYLPVVLNNFAVGPDLVVDDIVATTDSLNVTIRNIGNAPVNDPFWVDAYFNPTEIPMLNVPWSAIASQGVVWGIDDAQLPLNPGETRVLTLANAVQNNGYTSPPPYPVDVPVYVFVDSIDLSTTYGAVLETDESNNLSQATVAD